MGTEAGKQWQNRDPGVAWIETKKRKVNDGPDGIPMNDDDVYETITKIFVVVQVKIDPTGVYDYEAVKLAATKSLLNYAGKQDNILSVGYVTIENTKDENGNLLPEDEQVPHPYVREPNRPLWLCSMLVETFAGGILKLEAEDAMDADPNSPPLESLPKVDLSKFDHIGFPSYVEFSKRMEILALRFEEEYAVKTKLEGVMYSGPEESYGMFDFAYEAEALRDFYREIWDFLRKNGVKPEDPFAIVFGAVPWDPSYDQEGIWPTHMQEWFSETLNLLPIKITEAGFGGKPIPGVKRLTYGADILEANPLFADVRRLWLIKNIVKITGKMAPFAEYSTNVSWSAMDPDTAVLPCKSPAYAKEVPQFTHDEFVKRFVRPKPDLASTGDATAGGGSLAYKNALALIRWDSFGQDYEAATTEVATQWNKDWTDHLLREVVQNRRKSTSEYVGDYFMKNLPGAPAKIRSLHDVWTHVLSRIDFPTLIQDAMECMWDGFGLSLEDVLDMMCEKMLDEFFEKTTLKQYHEFAEFLASGKPIPGVAADSWLGESINITDVAHAIKDFIEEQAVGLTDEALSTTTLDPQTQGVLRQALGDRIGQSLNDPKLANRFLCDAIIAAAFIFGAGIMALVNAIRGLKEEEFGEEQKEKDPIPPFEKCGFTLDTLRDLPIVGTLYSQMIEKATEKIDEKVMEFIEEKLVAKVRWLLYFWEKWCIEEADSDISKLGAFKIDDFPKSSSDSKQLQKFFGEEFDYEKFINDLFAGLTDLEICNLMIGNTPTDEVARYVVQFVRNYPDIPPKIVNKVSEKSKVVSFFNSLSLYIDKSVCSDLLNHPQNLIKGPCDNVDFNYAQQMMKEALLNAGYSQEAADAQIEAQKTLKQDNFRGALDTLSETSSDFQTELEKEIKESAQSAFEDILTDSDTSAASLILNMLIEAVKGSFQSDVAHFYTILSQNIEIFDQIYLKLQNLIDDQHQLLFGEDDYKEGYTADPDTGILLGVSQYHNYNLFIELDQYVPPPPPPPAAGPDRCVEVNRQKQLMVDIMKEAGWAAMIWDGSWGVGTEANLLPEAEQHSAGPKFWNNIYFWYQKYHDIKLSGEAYRLYETIYDPKDKGEKNAYMGFPRAYTDHMEEYADWLWDTTNAMTAKVSPTMFVSAFFQGNVKIGSKELHGETSGDENQVKGVYGNLFDPANILNPANPYSVHNLTADQLDDLFRIAFRYYTRYSYNYEFKADEIGNYINSVWGNPKSECMVLDPLPDSVPGHPDFSREKFWGYRSFTIDPVVDLTDEQVAEHLKHVDFRIGHRGPGGTPTDGGSDITTWSDLLNRLGDKHPTGTPHGYGTAIIVNFGVLTWFEHEWAWGSLGNFAQGSTGEGWSVGNSKECLLRVFLLRFVLNGLWQDSTYSQFTYPGTFTDGPEDSEVAYGMGEWTVNNTSTKQIFKYESPGMFIAIGWGTQFQHKATATGLISQSEWDTKDYHNIIGGHMERALTYYHLGLDFHPGFSYYPYGGLERFTFSETYNDNKLAGPLHMLPFHKFKYSELAEQLLSTDDPGAKDPGYEVLKTWQLAVMLDLEDTNNSIVTELLKAQDPETSGFKNPASFYVTATEGPNEGEKVPIYRTMNRPRVVSILDCIEEFSDDTEIFNWEYDEVVHFALVAQRSSEYGAESTHCIIDRYVLKVDIYTDQSAPMVYEEEKKLIGVTGYMLVNPNDKSEGYQNNLVASDADRYARILEILKDEDYLGSDGVILPGTDFGGNVDVDIALQPQIFEKYIINRMRTNPIGLLPFIDPHKGYDKMDDQGLLDSTLLEDILVPLVGTVLPGGFLGQQYGTKQIYGVLARHIIKKIASLIYEQREALTTILEQSVEESLSLEVSFDNIRDEALEHYKQLIKQINPLAGDDLPSMEEILLSVSQDGSGAAAARILVKIIIIEYFIRATTMATTFSIDEVMGDVVMVNFFHGEIDKYINKFYDQAGPHGIWHPGSAKLKALIENVLTNELHDVVGTFEKFFKTEGYQKVIDQVILKNDQVYDLAKIKGGLYTYTSLDPTPVAPDYPKIYVLGFGTPPLGNAAPANAVRYLSTLTEPRFSYNAGGLPYKTGGSWIYPTPEIKCDLEGFFLEKYIKLKFHPQDQIESNLISSGVDPLVAEELARDIQALPIEYKGNVPRGGAWPDIEAEPVYLNVDDFKEAYLNIFHESPSITVGGSIFDWTQLPSPNGFGEGLLHDEPGSAEGEFDIAIEDAIANWDKEDDEGNKIYPYEDSVAGHIQKELAFLEMLCTLAAHPTPIDEMKVPAGKWVHQLQDCPVIVDGDLTTGCFVNSENWKFLNDGDNAYGETTISFLEWFDPYFKQHTGASPNSETWMSPGKPLEFSDLSRRTARTALAPIGDLWHIEVGPNFDEEEDLLINGWRDKRYFMKLNQIPPSDPRFIPLSGKDVAGNEVSAVGLWGSPQGSPWAVNNNIEKTRPFATKYLEHLSGQVYSNPEVQALIADIKDGTNACNKQVVAAGYSALDTPANDDDLIQVGPSKHFPGTKYNDQTIWSTIALAPLMVKNVFDFIPEAHRKLLTKIGFRYYTVKYFGDYSGFKMDPYELWGHSKISDPFRIIDNIFKGLPIRLKEVAGAGWEGLLPGVEHVIASGEFQGEAKGIAEQMFPDDEERRKIASIDGRGLFFGMDPYVFCGYGHTRTISIGGDAAWSTSTCVPIPLWWGAHFTPTPVGPSTESTVESYTWLAYGVEDPSNTPTKLTDYVGTPTGEGDLGELGEGRYPPGFSSHEEFERYMIFGLFFGFDCAAKWKIIQAQHSVFSTSDPDTGIEPLHSGGNNYPDTEMLNFAGHAEDPGNNWDQDMKLTSEHFRDFKVWTSSYQRDLFKAMQLYKGGLNGLPSPIEVFTNGTLISDLMPPVFDQDTPTEVEKLAISNYVEKASYGIRLSCLMPEDRPDATQDSRKNPLSMNNTKTFTIQSAANTNPDKVSFYETIRHHFDHVSSIANNPNGEPFPTSIDYDLLTIKRLKSYWLNELHVENEPGGSADHEIRFRKSMFILPLLEYDSEIPQNKNFATLLSAGNWHEGFDAPGNAGNQENWEFLYEAMKGKDEFKLLFEYVFPVKRMLSLMTAYELKTIADSSGGIDLQSPFIKTKELISELSLSSDT